MSFLHPRRLDAWGYRSGDVNGGAGASAAATDPEEERRRRKTAAAAAAAAGIETPSAKKLRLQVEYYLSDKNLVKDDFFREKIAEAGPEGWVSVDTFLACPRIR